MAKQHPDQSNAPVPPGPTDEDLIQTASDAGLCYPVCWDLPENQMQMQYLRNFARAVLARWGNTTPQPVPVSERLPGPEDCDAEGRCWFSPWHQQGYAPNWRLIEPYLRHFSDAWWLPAHALPIPGDNQ